MQPLSPQHVQNILHQHQLDSDLITYDASTATSELAAAAIGCTVAEIAKSMCYVIKGEPLLVVASGINTIDDRKLATLLDVGRKRVKMAKPDQCIEIFGYAPGGVPPVGHRTPDIRTILDQDLSRFERVYAAGGRSNVNFGITPHDLQRITDGTWHDVKKV